MNSPIGDGQYSVEKKAGQAEDGGLERTLRPSRSYAQAAGGSVGIVFRTVALDPSAQAYSSAGSANASRCA